MDNMQELQTIAEKIGRGERIGFEEACSLYHSQDLLFLAEVARGVKERISGREVYYNVNRHINLTNICSSGCPLCAFACEEADPGGFLLTQEQVANLVQRAIVEAPDLTEIHMVSALHPAVGYEYYRDMVQLVRRLLPQVHIKAFTPVEIVHFAAVSGKGIREILQELKSDGLDSLPGGGAEILDDAVRQKICPKKANTAQWIETIKTAHELGIPTNATMLYGHIETPEQRIRHLLALRDIQDQTSGFQAFVAFPFHPQNTEMAHLCRVSSWEDLKMIALARIVLDNFAHVKAFWMMLTMPVAQLALAFGADDLDGTVVEEKIIHAAGAQTSRGIDKRQIQAIIRETGYVPVERDTFYRSVVAAGKGGAYE